MENETRTCNTCAEPLPIESFRICRGRKGGTYRSRRCAVCTDAHQKERSKKLRAEEELPPPGTKRECTSCGVEQDLLEGFHKSPSGKYGRFSRCKTCVNSENKAWFDKNPEAGARYAAKWRETNPEKYAESRARESAKPGKAQYRYNWRLQKVYGITLAEYEQMLADQGGVCFICAARPTHSLHERLYVDHNHETGKVRKLLCMSCNVAIGHFRDRFDLMVKAALYMQEIPLYRGFYVVVPQPTPPPQRQHEICPFPDYLERHKTL